MNAGQYAPSHPPTPALQEMALLFIPDFPGTGLYPLTLGFSAQVPCLLYPGKGQYPKHPILLDMAITLPPPWSP